MARGLTTKFDLTHNSFVAMRSRCYCPWDRSFEDYGARGIRVCDRWLNSFENFLSDVGPRPDLNHTIDRIDPNGHYTPQNCRWATRVVQQNNRLNNVRLEIASEILTVGQASKKFAIPYSTILTWVRRHGLKVASERVLKRVQFEGGAA